MTDTSGHKLCAVPWHEIWLNPELQYSVCCKEDQRLTQKTDAVQSGMAAHWHGSYMQSVRADFLAGEAMPICKLCWQEEAENKVSMRLRKNLRYTGKTEPQRSDLHSDTIKGALISVGNQCQLRCISCNPNYSRSILKDYQRLGWQQDVKTRFNIEDSRGTAMHLNHAVLEDIKRITPDLEWLSVTGGEPTLSKNLMAYLSWCVEQNHAQRIRLNIMTNGVKIKQPWIDVMNQFKHTTVTVSTDAMGALENYVRWPTVWDSKAACILSTKTAVSNLTLHSVIHSVNVLGLSDLLSWSNHHAIWHSLEALVYPECLNIQHLPQKVKHKAMSMLQKIPRQIAGADLFDRDRYLNNCLDSLMSRLMLPGDPEQTQKLLDIIHAYDTIRPTPLKNILPEFAEFSVSR